MVTMKHRIPIFASALALLIAIDGMLGAPLQQGRKHDPNTPEAIPIVVLPHGFPQRTLSLPQGHYVFVVLNRSGLRDLTVFLERMPANSLTDPPAAQEFGGRVGGVTHRLSKGAKLNPGTYRLRVANRPAWVCAIQVR